MAKIIRNFNNEPQYVVIDGRQFHFRSKLEYRWALYLQLLKNAGEIQDWFFEETEFVFEGETRGAKVWLMDFDVLTTEDKWEYYECKGWPEGRDITKDVLEFIEEKNKTKKATLEKEKAAKEKETAAKK